MDTAVRVILGVSLPLFGHRPFTVTLVYSLYHGPGIAAEHQAHIFERFYRTDESRNRKSGGAGLGLAISRAIAEAHGGTLEVSSSEGEASTFTLSIPEETQTHILKG